VHINRADFFVVGGKLGMGMKRSENGNGD